MVSCVVCFSLCVLCYSTRLRSKISSLQQHAMAPRCTQKGRCRIGSIVKREGSENIFYRVQVSLTLDGLKRTVHGPLRTSMVLAERDLEHAQTAVSHEEMGRLLRALHTCSKQRRPERGHTAAWVVKGRAAKERDAKERGLGCKEEGIQCSSSATSVDVSVITGALGETLSRDAFMRRVDEIKIWVADHMLSLIHI